jgi:ADP-heptose:LPS heptosyltransferase
MTKRKLKILVIRFSSIGDIVLTTPIIRCLSTQLGAEVHLLTKKDNASWLKPNPHIHQIIPFEDNYVQLIEKLQQTEFDHVIDLHKNIRSKRIIRGLSCSSYTFDKQNVNKWLLVNFKIDRMTSSHIVDRYFQAVTVLGVDNDGLGLDFFLPQINEVHPLILALPSEYIVISLGASYGTKRMHIKLLQDYVKDTTKKYVLLGGVDVSYMSDILEGESHVINLVGKINLLESALVVKNANLVITGDSAIMHVAAAFKKKIIAVWGNTTPKFGMEPYYGQQENKHINLEVEGLSCRPCSKLGHQECPRKHFKCMKDIGIDRLNDATNRLISDLY